MIRIVKPAKPPQILMTKGAEQTRKDCAAYDNSPADYRSGEKTFNINNNIYRYVWKSLSRAQYNKCCYCESKFLATSYGPVEHYRPKGAVQQAPGQKKEYPGYYWLAYDWNNLLFSCTACNTKKRELFPLIDKKARARSHHDDVTMEQPLLINPTVEDPRDHIRFREDVPEHLTKIGKAGARIGIEPAFLPMDAYGLLKNISDVDKVAPMQKWARDLYELRQRNFLKDDPMYLACKPPGGPRQFEQIYGLQFVENPDFNRILVLLGGGNRNRRVIYTDGREQIGQINGDADNPLYYGRAVAHWEGDTMVVDIKGFNEKFWMDNGGLPHTEKLHLIERFTRTDMKTMKYEVTIDDPGTYTRTWKSSWTLEWIPGEETPYFLCQDNRP